MNIAIVTKNKERDNILAEYIDIEADLYYLTDSSEKKILKKDITLDLEFLNEYDYVILVGSDATKHIAKIGSVLKNQGFLINDKWIPITSPKMLKFNPAGIGSFEQAISNIKKIINGTVATSVAKKYLLQNEEEIENLFDIILSDNPDTIALDTETTGLYCRDGYVLGISLTYEDDIGYYLDADYITEEAVDKLIKIKNFAKHVVFHNAKFDMHMLKYHFGLEFDNFDDTMLLHYCLNEDTGTHGLKELCMKYTDLGDYEKPLDDFKIAYCKKHGIKKGDFTYDLIPFEILGEYAALDTVGTYKLFKLFYDKVNKSAQLWKVYSRLLIPGTKALQVIEDNGVPIDKNQVIIESGILDNSIKNLEEDIYSFNVIHEFEKNTGNIFNSNSVIHKRTVLFDMLGLRSIGKKTDTGQLSVDAEVMADLAEQHDLPKLIAKIAKDKKIRSTYINKLALSLDPDSRLRTNFSLQTTTSGRLSSSGKLNMQQLPRENKAPKRCIKARDGYKIVSGDLGTAEVYIVSVLSKDPVLQQVFKDGKDFHSSIARLVNNVNYTDDELKITYKSMRNDAKAVSFEILYKLNLNHDVLKKFKVLKKWLMEQRDFILQNGYTYQFFGRKRRLPDVFSSDRQVRDHAVRSGVNSLVQGPSSDVNLLACIDLINYIKDNNMKSKVFAMVHDSILAEVPDEEVELYSEKLKDFMQADRGLSIHGTNIGVDIEIGQSYAFE